MISTIYHFEFPATLSANKHRLISKLTNLVIGWKWIVEIILQYGWEKIGGLIVIFTTKKCAVDLLIVFIFRSTTIKRHILKSNLNSRNWTVSLYEWISDNSILEFPIHHLKSFEEGNFSPVFVVTLSDITLLWVWNHHCGQHHVLNLSTSFLRTTKQTYFREVSLF